MINKLKEIINEMSRRSRKSYKKFTYIIKQKKVDTQSSPLPCHSESTPNVAPASKVLIYKSELEFISRCILDYTNIETGGQLFGYWTSDGIPVILYVIGPGPYANHQGAFFNQDINYLETVGKILTKDFGLQHMGEWHSHHQLGLARPSSHDSANIYNNMVRHNIERFLLCIGNCNSTTSTVNAFNFHISSPNYKESIWDVLNIDSPFRSVIDQKLSQILVHPRTQHASLSNMHMIGNYNEKPQVKTMYNEGYWLNDKQNNMALKNMMDIVNASRFAHDTRVSLDSNKLIHIITGENYPISIDIIFPMGFPAEAPLINVHYNGKKYVYCKNGEGWIFTGSIVDSFNMYFEQFVIKLQYYDGQ